MLLLQRFAPHTDPIRPLADNPHRHHILGHPKSGKTLELVRRAFQAAHRGEKTLLLSQNPVETSALQEKAWMEQQKHHRTAPQEFALKVTYSHSLLEDLVNALFPQLGYFTAPIWVHANNTQPLRLQEALRNNQISVPLALFLLTRPGNPTEQQFQQADFQFDSIFCDDATLQPGYIHELLPRLLKSQGTLTEVRLRSNPKQIYFLRSDPSAHQKHFLSIQVCPYAPLNNAKKTFREPFVGRWVVSSLKKILLNEFEFAFPKSKPSSLDIALGLPLGSKKGQDFDLDYPWLETKRWRRYLLEHQERLGMPSCHCALIEIAPVGLHPAAGSSILTRQLRGTLKNPAKNKPASPLVHIFCQPYFNLYGHFYDWLLLPFLDKAFLPKTEHRQLHYLWFLASRARNTICFCPSSFALPKWLMDPGHPIRRTLEKSIAIQIKN